MGIAGEPMGFKPHAACLFLRNSTRPTLRPLGLCFWNWSLGGWASCSSKHDCHSATRRLSTCFFFQHDAAWGHIHLSGPSPSEGELPWSGRTASYINVSSVGCSWMEQRLESWRGLPTSPPFDLRWIRSTIFWSSMTYPLWHGDPVPLQNGLPGAHFIKGGTPE